MSLWSMAEISRPWPRAAAANYPGQILHVLHDGITPLEELEGICREMSENDIEKEPPTIVALSADSDARLSLVRECEVWKWIGENVAELRSDRIAKSEVSSRISTLEGRIRDYYSPIVGGRGHSLDVSRSRWFSDGVEIQVESTSDLQSLLSDRCNEIFHASPVLHNELINRDQPSSSASKAIRNIIESMLKYPDDPRLGIVKYPPEITILEGMLRFLESTG